MYEGGFDFFHFEGDLWIRPVWQFVRKVMVEGNRSMSTRTMDFLIEFKHFRIHSRM